MREQCAWCLGNIAGDCTELRDLVLQHGAMQPLLANVARPENQTILRNATWTLSNFCRGKPQVAMDSLRAAAPALISLLSSTDQVSAAQRWNGVRARSLTSPRVFARTC